MRSRRRREAVPYMKASLVEAHASDRPHRGRRAGVVGQTASRDRALALTRTPREGSCWRPEVGGRRSRGAHGMARLAGLRAVQPPSRSSPVAADGENVMPATIAAARAGATTGSGRTPCARPSLLPRPDASATQRPRRPRSRSSSCATRSRASVSPRAQSEDPRRKPGLDGTRTARADRRPSARLRDGVVYEGIRLTPSQIARSAVDEGST